MITKFFDNDCVNNNVIAHAYNGVVIKQRIDDQFVNLTQMCNVGGKRLDNWVRLKSTKEYISCLARSLECEVTDLIIIRQGGVPEMQGTWGHKLVAIELAGWINVQFKIWANRHLLELVETGSTTVTPKIPQTYAEALLEAGRLALENEKLTAKIKEDAPLVDFADAVRFSDDSVDFLTYAKMINTGRTRLFRKMREAGIIMKHTTLPYQAWLDAGFFEVSQEVTPDGKLRPFALVTGKGQLWLKQKLDSLESSLKSCELELDLGM